MPDTFVQDASQLWSDPSLASQTRTCFICGLQVPEDHESDGCLASWIHKLRGLIEDANREMRKKKEAA